MLVVKLNFYSTYQCLCAHLLFLAGEKRRLWMYLSLNHSFKSTDSSSNETSKSWVSHWIIEKFHEILFSCLIFFLQNCERTTTFIKKKKKTLFCTQTTLNRVRFLCRRLIFIHGIPQQWNVLQKETQNKYIWLTWFFVTTLELKMDISRIRIDALVVYDNMLMCNSYWKL